jgi:hypothetical protein
MKKLHLLILAGVALVAVSVYAYEQVRRDAAGLHIGSAVTDRIGMWGATPVVRQTITNTAPVLATLTVSSATITYSGVDGSTNSISVVTNVAINAIAGYSGTNQLNQVRNALVNVGIASTTGQ